MSTNDEHGTPGGSPPPPPPDGGLPQNQQFSFQPPYAPPPPPEDMGTVKVVGLSALACCIPLIGPLIALIFGIIDRAKRGAIAVIVIGAVMLVLSIPILGVYAAVIIPLYITSAPESVQQEFDKAMGGDFAKIRIKSKEAEVKQNLHMIQLSLERYALDLNGAYPASVDLVVYEEYLTEFPNNPFSDSPILVVDLSDTPEAREGNFSYLPTTTDGKITGYTLLGYGSVDTTESAYPGGEGPAAVVIELTSGY